MKDAVQTLHHKDAEQVSNMVEGLEEMLVRLADGWEIAEVLGLEKFLMRKRAGKNPKIREISAIPA